MEKGGVGVKQNALKQKTFIPFREGRESSIAHYRKYLSLMGKET
jgi:hypothetical protein